jgi:hypothetical protein
MIRPFTLITMLLAAGSGAYLFAVKHHAQLLDDQIASVSQASRLDGQRIRVLQAQWALETDPTRLQQLATQFTHLQPMRPAQLVTLAALKFSLPAPGSAPPGSNPELPGQMLELDASNAPPDAMQADADPQAPLSAGGLPLPPPPAPMLLASVPAPKAVAPRPVRHFNHSTLAGSELAEALPQPRPYAATHDVQTAAAPTESYRALPMGAQVMSVKATAPMPQYVPPTPPVSPDDSGSALGMAADVPAPQPLQPGLNN